MGSFSYRAALGLPIFLIGISSWTASTWAQPPHLFQSPTRLAAVNDGMAQYTYPTTGMAAPVPGNGPALGWQMPPNRQMPPSQHETWVSQPAVTAQGETAESVLTPRDNAVSSGNGIGSGLTPWGDLDGDLGACGDCGGDPCCNSLGFGGVGGSPFSGNRPYFTFSGLVFTRGKPEFYQMSFDDTELTGSEISSVSGVGNWDAGPEIGFTMPLGCGRAFEAVYWGIYGDNRETTANAADIPGNLNTTFDFTLMTIGADNVNDLYDGAAAHRLRRNYDIHNVEMNFLCGALPAFGCKNIQLGYLAGLRYLQYSEGFEYASADADPVFGNDPANEAYYNVDLENHLFGLQLGMRADWYVQPRFSLFAATKFGIYNNYIEHQSVISNVNGIATFVAGNPLSGQAYDIVSNTNSVATIGELDLGTSYQLSCHWSATLGYRAVALGGVAMPTAQLPGKGRMPGVEGIVRDSTMLLHGAYASIGFYW